MSFTDPQADVQPEEGQGDTGTTSDAPYAEYLNRIPEEVRGTVEPIFKEWDGNVTKRFQDHADFRKQWEPLQDTGVNQLSRDEVAWLVQFRQALDDPQTMQQWWDSYAQENGLTPAQQQQVPEPQTFDEFGGFQDPQQLQSLIDQATGPLKQELEQMKSHIEQQQQQQQLAEANQYVERQVQELEQKHGKLDEEQRQVLAVFAGKYADSDYMNAIPRGYEDMVKFTNQIEKQALQPKVNAPSPAEGGGVPDTSPQQFKNINDPGLQEAAKEWMRNNRG